MNNPLFDIIKKNYFIKKTNNKILLHEPTFDYEDIYKFTKQFLTTKVTMGKEVRNFEEKFAKKFLYSNAISCNSGSSANLLAISAVCNIDYKRKIPPNSEVIVPALSWSTTVWPLIQNNLIPVFVDVDKNTYNIDVDQIENAITKKTKAIMPVHVYGNPCDMAKIMKLANKYNLIIIEDSCKSMGAKYQNKYVGSFGEIGTFSTYYSHHITTLEGGICVTKNNNLRDLLKILRSHGWVREVKNQSKYFIKDIDKKFLFPNLGYNLRITEPQGVLGQNQLKKFDKIVRKRRSILKYYQKEINAYGDFFDYQKEQENGYSSAFGFCINLKKNKFFKVMNLRKFLEKNGIETRPIICGNITRQPFFKKFKKYKISNNLKNSNDIMQNSFAIGCHQNVTNENVQRFISIVKKFLKKI